MQEPRAISASFMLAMNIMTATPAKVTQAVTISVAEWLRLMPMVSTSFVTRLRRSPKEAESKRERGMRLSFRSMSPRMERMMFWVVCTRVTLWV